MKKLLLSVLCLTLLVFATFFVSGCKKKHTHSFTEQTVKDEYLSTAANIENAKHFRNTNYEEYKLGSSRIVRMTIKRDIIHCEFMIPKTWYNINNIFKKVGENG